MNMAVVSSNPLTTSLSPATRQAVAEGRSMGRLALGAAGMMSMYLLCGAALLTISFSAVPCFERVFADFNAMIPAMTQLTLGLVHWLERYYFLLVVPTVAHFVLYLVLASRSSKWNWLGTAWAFTLPLFTVVALTWIIVSMAIPMVHLTQQLR